MLFFRKMFNNCYWVIANPGLTLLKMAVEKIYEIITDQAKCLDCVRHWLHNLGFPQNIAAYIAIHFFFFWLKESETIEKYLLPGNLKGSSHVKVVLFKNKNKKSY